MRLSINAHRLLALAALALVLRIATVLVLWNPEAPPETFEHGQIAQNLLAGRGFSIEFLGSEGPTSQQAPFYPFLLAGVYSCLGTGSAASLLAVQFIQCLAGTALVLAVVWISWSLLPERPEVGWTAGLGAALYPTHLYMVTHFQVAVWAALLLSLVVGVAVSPRWQGRFGGAALLGFLGGALMLVEPILALAVPVAAAAFWVGEQAKGWGRLAWRPAARAMVVAAVAAVVIAPWLLRNRRVHGEWVFVKSTFGYAFWQGNNPASWGTDKIPKPSADALRTAHDGTLASMDRALWAARHETLYIDDVVLRPAGYGVFQGLSEPERSRLLARRAWDFIKTHPARYAHLCLRRLQYFLLFDITNPKAANRLYRLSTVVWLVLAFLGLGASLGHARRLWPTYAVFFPVLAFHAAVIVSARFRIPVEPLSFVWAAWPLAPLTARLLQSREVKVYRPGQRAAEAAAADQHALKGPHFTDKPQKKAGRGRQAA